MAFDYKPHKKSNAYADWGEVYKRNLVREQIEQQRQAELQAQQNKQNNNLIVEGLDILNTGQYVSQGFQQGLIQEGVGQAFSNAGKGLIAGLTPWMDDARYEASQTRQMMEDSGYQVGFSDTYDSWGESWQGFKDGGESRNKALRSFANGALEFTWDVASDPMTYVTFGASALIKGGKKVANEAVEKGLKEVTERAMNDFVMESAEKSMAKFAQDKTAEYVAKGIPEDIIQKKLAGVMRDEERRVLSELQEKFSKVYKTDEDTMNYYVSKLNKVGGTNNKTGINAFGVQLTDGKLMSAIGDATIAPYYHKAMNALSESKVVSLFNHSPGLRRLAHESPELAYKQIRAIDDFTRLKQLGLVENDKLMSKLDELLVGYTDKQKQQIFEMIDNNGTLSPDKLKDPVRFKGSAAFNREVSAQRREAELLLEEKGKSANVVKSIEELLNGNVVDNLMKSPDNVKHMVKGLLDPYDKYNSFDEVIKSRGKIVAGEDTKYMKAKILVNDVNSGRIPDGELSTHIADLYNLDEVSTRSLLRERLGTDAIEEKAFDAVTVRPDFNTLDNATLDKLINDEVDKLIMETPEERAKRGYAEAKKNAKKEFEHLYSRERLKFDNELVDDLKSAQALYKEGLDDMPALSAYQKLLDDEQFLKDMIDYKALGIDGLDTGFTRLIKDEEGLFLQRATKWSYELDGKKIKITDEMARVALEVRKILNDMGMREMEIGLLEKQMKNYAPHYLNPEALNNKKVMDALRSGDPELYQKAISGSGLFNQSDLERGLSAGHTVQQTNALIKPLLEQAGFDGDLYINNVYDAVMARGRQHNKVMYGGEYGDSMLAQFGVRISPEMLDSKKKYYISQTDFSKIFRDADPKTVEAYMGGLSKYHGKTLIQVTSDEYKRIAEMYNKNVIHNAGKGVGLNAKLPVYDLPSYIGHSVQRVGEVAQMKEAKAFIKMYDKFTNVFKTGATASRMGFHANNLRGNMFNTWLSTGVETLSPDVQKAKVQLIAHMNKAKKGEYMNPVDGVFKTAKGDIPLEEVLRFWDLRHGANRVDDIYGTATQGGIKDVFNGATLNPFDVQNGAWFKASHFIGDQIETSSRLDVFLATLKQGKTIEEAFETSNKVLFDYGDLTDFERSVMRRAVPFYTFTSKNLGFMWEQLMENPTRLRMFMNGYLDAIDSDSMFIDEYAQNYLTTGQYTDENGNQIIQKTSANLPVDMFLNKFSVIDQLSPTIKLLPELITNKKTFDGNPITSQYDDPLQQNLDRLDYVTETMFPAWRSTKDVLGINRTKDIIEDGKLLADRTDEVARQKMVKWWTGYNTRDFNVTQSERSAIERAIRSIEKAKRDAEKENKPTKKKTKQELQNEKLKEYGY